VPFSAFFGRRKNMNAQENPVAETLTDADGIT
jgi:hypothetical protein